MEIDAATRRNLELLRSLAGERQGSPARDHRPHAYRRRARACWRAAGRAR